MRFEWLAEHAEGLIALSGCRKGEVAALAERGESAQAREAAQPLPRRLRAATATSSSCRTTWSTRTRTRNEALVALARDLGLGIVATNNVHYDVQEQHRLHDVLVAVQHHTNLEEARPHLRANAEFYLKPPAEMERLFADLPEAIENTARIAERCRGFDLTRDLSYEFPDYDSGDGRSADEFLRDTCYRAGARALLQVRRAALPENVVEPHRQGAGADPDPAVAPASSCACGTSCATPTTTDLPVRGRGSSVGSLVCFLLGLSGIDPIKYDLAVERFLSEDRPDQRRAGRRPRLRARRARPDVPPRLRDLHDGARGHGLHLHRVSLRQRHPRRRQGAGPAGEPRSTRSPSACTAASPRGLRARDCRQMPEFAHRMQFPIWQDFIAPGGAAARPAAAPQPALRRHDHLDQPHGRAGAGRGDGDGRPLHLPVGQGLSRRRRLHQARLPRLPQPRPARARPALRARSATAASSRHRRTSTSPTRRSTR